MTDELIVPMTSHPTPESVELLPCPFCGHNECWFDEAVLTSKVTCVNCVASVSVYKGTVAEAITKWNTRPAAQSARVPEDVAKISTSLHDAINRDDPRYPTYLLRQAADTIEQQAAEIERLKEENKALGIADAHHFDEYAELKARAEVAEARCTAMEKLNDILSVKLENRTNLVECLTTERDEARAMRMVEELAALREAFSVGVWTEEEKRGMEAAYNRADGKHGFYETLFAVAAFILRHRKTKALAALTGEQG